MLVINYKKVPYKYLIKSTNNSWLLYLLICNLITFNIPCRSWFDSVLDDWSEDQRHLAVDLPQLGIHLLRLGTPTARLHGGYSMRVFHWGRGVVWWTVWHPHVVPLRVNWRPPNFSSVPFHPSLALPSNMQYVTHIFVSKYYVLYKKKGLKSSLKNSKY